MCVESNFRMQFLQGLSGQTCCVDFYWRTNWLHGYSYRRYRRRCRRWCWAQKFLSWRYWNTKFPRDVCRAGNNGRHSLFDWITATSLNTTEFLKEQDGLEWHVSEAIVRYFWSCGSCESTRLLTCRAKSMWQTRIWILTLINITRILELRSSFVLQWPFLWSRLLYRYTILHAAYPSLNGIAPK